MANTLGDMITRVRAETFRPDLTDAQITAAIYDAIAIYQKDRFRFSDIDPANPPSWPTVANRSVYDSNDNANIGTLLLFDYLNVLYGSTVLQMYRRTPEALHLLIQQGQAGGPPSDWAYEGNKIIIYPIPTDNSFTIIMGGHLRVAAPATAIEVGNPWMTLGQGERLIRSRTKYLIAVHITRNLAMMTAMSPEEDGGPNGQPGESYLAWSEIKGEGNKITGRGRVRAMQF